MLATQCNPILASAGAQFNWTLLSTIRLFSGFAHAADPFFKKGLVQLATPRGPRIFWQKVQLHNLAKATAPLGWLLTWLICLIRNCIFWDIEGPFWYLGGLIFASWVTILVIHGSTGTAKGAPWGLRLDFHWFWRDSGFRPEATPHKQTCR